MDFPLLKNIKVIPDTVEFLNRKFEQFSKEQTLHSGDNIFVSKTGVHTGNLCNWKDQEFTTFLNKTLLDLCSQQLDLPKEKIYVHFTHFFDYGEGGEVRIHHHADSEDFVLFVYTNTCSEGCTIFYLNDRSKDTTEVKIKPIYGEGVIFSSLVQHK